MTCDHAGFPGGASGKESIHLSVQETGETWVRSLGWEDPWSRKWQPTPVFLPGESHRQRGLGVCSPWSHRVRHNWAHMCTPYAALEGISICLDWGSWTFFIIRAFLKWHSWLWNAVFSTPSSLKNLPVPMEDISSERGKMVFGFLPSFFSSFCFFVLLHTSLLHGYTQKHHTCMQTQTHRHLHTQYDAHTHL